jgi:hypothetical protein
LNEDNMSAHTSTLTAPVQETASTGMREEPTIGEEELRRHANEFAVRVRQRSPEKTHDDLKKYLERLRLRLKESVPRWKEGTSTTALTPKL